MPATHRLTALSDHLPELASAELRAHLRAAKFNITATSAAIGLARSKVHALIVRLNLGAWVEGERAKIREEMRRCEKSTEEE